MDAIDDVVVSSRGVKHSHNVVDWLSQDPQCREERVDEWVIDVDSLNRTTLQRTATWCDERECSEDVARAAAFIPVKHPRWQLE